MDKIDISDISYPGDRYFCQNQITTPVQMAAPVPEVTDTPSYGDLT
jgi:hypothetical protein